MIEKEFRLVRHVLEFTGDLPITEEKFKAISEAKKGLLEAMFAEEKFDLVMQNYLELEMSFLDSTAQCMVFGNQDSHWMNTQRALFNRRIVNLLTACKSYLDHIPQHLKILKIQGEPATDIFKAITSKNYDDCLGYRVMEALRNHVQHFGFPVHSLSFPLKWVGEGDSGRMRAGLDLHMNIEELRKNGGFKSLILTELKPFGKRIPLKLFARQYVAGLGDVHRQARALFEPSIVTWETTILAAILDYKSKFPEDTSVAGLSAVMVEGGVEADSVSVFTGFIDYRKALHKKNRNQANLDKRYATSEILDD